MKSHNSAVTPHSPKLDKFIGKVLKLANRVQRWIFIKSQGRLANTFRGAPVGLLTTKGRKTGAKRKICLVYYENDTSIAIVASKAGCATHPLWYRNLQSSPECTFQIGPEIYLASAHDAEGEEYDFFWGKITEVYPDFEMYRLQARAASGRNVPLVILNKKL